MDWKGAQERLAGSWLVRCVVDAVLRGRARRRLVELDHRSLARCQARILRGLVHRARSTRFGRDHDFHRIRTPADFRRLVPLRTAAGFGQEYGPTPLSHPEGAAWPEKVLHLLSAEGSPGGALAFVPITASLLESHRAAALTALAMVMNARPAARLLSGRILLAARAAAPAPLGGHAPEGRLEEHLLANLPAFLRPCPVWTAIPQDCPGLMEGRFHVSVEEGIRLPVTCVAGPAGRLKQLFELVRRATGRDRLADVWPRLTAVIGGYDSSGVTHSQLGELVGSPPVLCLGAWFRPEGALAVEDPRHELLRLLVDHGIYFEFVPLEALDDPEPVRHGAAEVDLGVPYAVAVTSPAGLWACLTGPQVRFEKRRPLLLEPLEPAALPRPAAEVARAPAEAPAPRLIPQPPHRRSGGIPAVPPGMPFHSPWSVPGDRG